VTDLPAGYVVSVGEGDRIHFLDWVGPGEGDGVVLIHGLSQTGWIWAPVARRLAGHVPTIAMDLRGHGLSDAPTDDGAYDLDVLADDVEAVAEGSGLLDDPDGRLVLVGHGFGAIVAATAARRMGPRCRGLVLVDGGWERLETATGLDVEAFLREIPEPPEVMASLRAFVRDRRGFHPASWDDDQERAALATVVETHAGRLVPATRPHALEASVRAMFGYDPIATLAGPDATGRVVALLASDDREDSRARALAELSERRIVAGAAPIRSVPFEATGHNLMRYRPAEVTAEILTLIP